MASSWARAATVESPSAQNVLMSSHKVRHFLELAVVGHYVVGQASNGQVRPCPGLARRCTL